MASSIDQNYVNQYSANVFHLSQQKGSVFAPLVRNETQNSESAFYDSLGQAVAHQRVARFEATPIDEVAHARRMVTMTDWNINLPVDNIDKLRMIQDPTSEYAVAAMWAFGRAKDDIIIAAALGSVYTGKAGGTTTAYANANRLAAFDGSTATALKMNVETLRAIKKYFDKGQVDKSIKRYIAVDAEQVEGLLSETEITNADYASVKALVNGEVNSFMGFEFVQTERLLKTAAATYFAPTTGGVDASLAGIYTGTAAIGSTRVLAWAQDGILLSTGQDIKSRIDERSDLNYITQVYCSMTLGATRMEEAKVLEVICKVS